MFLVILLITSSEIKKIEKMHGLNPSLSSKKFDFIESITDLHAPNNDKNILIKDSKNKKPKSAVSPSSSTITYTPASVAAVEQNFVDKIYEDNSIMSQIIIDCLSDQIQQVSGCTFKNIVNINKNFLFRIQCDIPFFDNIFEYDEIYNDRPAPIWFYRNGKLIIQRCTFINCMHRMNIAGGNVLNSYVYNANVTFESCNFINCGNNTEGVLIVMSDDASCLIMRNCSITFNDGSTSSRIFDSNCATSIFDQCNFSRCGGIRMNSNRKDYLFQFTNNIVENLSQDFISSSCLYADSGSIIFTDNFFSNVKYNELHYFISLITSESIEVINNTFSNFSMSSDDNVGYYGAGTSSYFQASHVTFFNCSFIDIQNSMFQSPYNNGGSLQCGFTSSDLNVQLDFEKCRFIRNKSEFGKGGAISINISQNVTITDCYFKDNKSYEEGGALYISGDFDQLGKALITNCEFIGNNGIEGAAIYFENTNSVACISMNKFIDNGDERTKFMICSICKEFIFEDNSVEFTNASESSGIFLVRSVEHVYLNNCSFINSTHIDGNIKLEGQPENSIFTIIDCHFYDCRSISSDSCIIEISNGISEVESCTFSFNNKSIGSRGINFGSKGFIINKCTFTRTNSIGAIKNSQMRNDSIPISITECTFDECYGYNHRCFHLDIYSTSFVFKNNIIQNMIEAGRMSYFGSINIHDKNRNFELENITFINNRCNSEYSGGTGLWITGVDTITFVNCKFINNTALATNITRSHTPDDLDSYYPGDGGAIQYGFSPTISDVNLVFTDCLFYQNKAIRHGGAIAIQTQKKVEITNCTFEENIANFNSITTSAELLYENHFNKKKEGRGGAIYINPSFTTRGISYYLKSISITGCTFKLNKAFDGYAIYIEGDDAGTIFDIINNEFIDNYDESIHTLLKSVITSEVTGLMNYLIISRNTYTYTDPDIFVSPFLFVDHYGNPASPSLRPTNSPSATVSPDPTSTESPSPTLLLSCPDEIEHCIECYAENNRIKCSKCDAGYYANDGGLSCDLCHNICETCRDKYYCLTCKKGYFLEEVLCFKCVSNCEECDSLDCLKCNPKYYLSDGLCYKCADICHECIGPTESDCIECEAGYFYSGANRRCFKCHESCIDCTGPNDYECLSCSEGYFLLQNIYIMPNVEGSKCTKCEEGCLNCVNTRKCVRCKSGYRLVNNNGNPSCEPCEEGCAICSESPEKCIACSIGYYANSIPSQDYVNCTKCPPNCHECFIDDGGELICMTCFDGYYKDNETGTCNECKFPCSICSSIDSCLSCVPGYLLEGNSCDLQCSSICLTCKYSSDICDSCRDGYTLSGTTCIKCPVGCKMCEITQYSAVCLSCLDGYYKDGDNCFRCQSPCETCFSSNLYSGCYSCEAGYFMNQIYTVPTPYAGQCKKCSEQVEHCSECSTKCIDEDLDSFQTCHNFVCTNCDDGYFVSEENGIIKCASCPQNCISCNKTSCIECQNGYFLNEQKECEKIQCSDNCKECDGFNCTKCNDGYIILWDSISDRFVCIEILSSSSSEEHIESSSEEQIESSSEEQIESSSEEQVESSSEEQIESSSEEQVESSSEEQIESSSEEQIESSSEEQVESSSEEQTVSSSEEQIESSSEEQIESSSEEQIESSSEEQTESSGNQEESSSNEQSESLSDEQMESSSEEQVESLNEESFGHSIDSSSQSQNEASSEIQIESSSEATYSTEQQTTFSSETNDSENDETSEESHQSKFETETGESTENPKEPTSFDSESDEPIESSVSSIDASHSSKTQTTKESISYAFSLDDFPFSSTEPVFGSQSTNPPKKKISKGALIGIICAVIAVLLIAAIVIVVIVKMRRKQSSIDENSQETKNSKVSGQTQFDTSSVLKNQDSSENDLDFWI